MTAPSPESIRAALDCIPPDLPRDEWARVAMALKSELGAGGLELFDAWSARGEKYSATATRETWRSVKAGGAVGIGTLFYLAQAHGYRPSEAAAPAVRAAVQASAQRRADGIARDLAEREARQVAAAELAARQWDAAAETGTPGYLTAKGLQGLHGARADGDELVVPMRAADGALWNLQRIKPAKPADGTTDKRFLKGGRKTGLMHWIGRPEGASVLLVGEGFATCASLHEATGMPLAVAFDAGNLVHVAKAVRKAWPEARIIVCADDDQATERRTGRNPGHEKATEAARAVRGLVARPEGLAAGGTDFNDLARAAGLEAVRACIERTLEAAPHGAQGRGDVQTPAQTPDRPADGSPGLPHGFEFRDGWLWFADRQGDGHGGAAVKVCDELRVEALTVDVDGGNAGYLLAFRGVRGDDRQWVMPARMLAGDGTEYRAALLGMGLRIAPGKRPRELLGLYLQLCRPQRIAQCVDRVGWHGRAFVLPRETLRAGDDDGRDLIVFQSDGIAENTFRQRGTLDAWRSGPAALCVGNSRLVFGVCCAFAGPMLRPAGVDGGGVHLYGPSAGGKSTVLYTAGSVYGGPNYVQTWRATDSALESIAAQHCDGLLPLDEVGQVEARTVGACAYMLGNGQGKARSNRNGDARQRLTWRLLFLSSGEVTLGTHIHDGGGRVHAGQEVRMVDVPADAGAGCGAFEALHGHEGGAAFANALRRATEAAHGTAGRAWLEWAVAHADTLRDRLRGRIDELTAKWVPDAASGQVHRVGQRFALIAAAGELATEAGITGWRDGEATRSVYACFKAWLEARVGGAGNSEDAQMVRQVRAWLTANQDARLTAWERDHKSERAPRTVYAAGFRKDVTDAVSGDVVGRVFFVQADVFRQEVCQGFDHRAVCRIGIERAWLEPGQRGEYSRSERLPVLGNTRCYRITSAIFDDDE